MTTSTREHHLRNESDLVAREEARNAAWDSFQDGMTHGRAQALHDLARFSNRLSAYETIGAVVTGMEQHRDNSRREFPVHTRDEIAAALREQLDLLTTCYYPESTEADDPEPDPDPIQPPPPKDAPRASHDESPMLTFGKYVGRSLADVPTNYVIYIYDKSRERFWRDAARDELAARGFENAK